MGNCPSFKGHNKKDASAFDRVTSRTSTSDDCLLYQLADYQKGGDLIRFFAKEGPRATEELLKEQIPLLLYQKGRGRVVTKLDYLKWKYRSRGNSTNGANGKDTIGHQHHVSIPMDEDVPNWEDHQACWNFEYRGSLGESLLHVLIVCNSFQHTKLAKMLVTLFNNLALDVVEGDEFKGASALHLAIAYNNWDMVKLLVESGAIINQRAIGTFFLPKDQQKSPPSRTTDYEGLAYFGELPICWAACCNNESAYNLLIDRGADPNEQDSFGNMVLHMVVVRDKLEMYGYALRHPRLPAKMGIINKAGLTPLTLSCHLGRANVFREMLELTAKEFWRYSNITCSAYPLNALDSILPDGRSNLNSALVIILNGTKAEHLDMLDGGIIQRLLEEKWKTFARLQFLKRLAILFVHLFVLSAAVYSRPDRTRPLMPPVDELEPLDYSRFCFEIITCLSCCGFLIVQQNAEIKNLGLAGFFRQLIHNPAKVIFLTSNFLTLSCIPFRLLGDRDTEEKILILALPSAWFFLMFFAGAVPLTGPFVTMIYSMIGGDMLTFGIIYAVMLLAFSQAFFFLHRGHPDSPPLFTNYFSTWMGLFQWTLGDYNYPLLGETIYPGLTTIIFVIFMVMVPILLLNMLIAMMGNTYSLVIQQSEKEFVKQWAKIVIALERAVSQTNAKEYLVSYSIKVSGGSDGSDGSPPQEEVRGVMVIKSKNKTRSRQRKGAISNWKRVGRVTIKELKRRGITGETLRREIWDPKTPSTQSPNASNCATPVPSAAALLLMGDLSGLGGGGGTGLITHHEPSSALPSFGDALLAGTTNSFNHGPSFNDLSGIADKINATGLVNFSSTPAPSYASTINHGGIDPFSDALLTKLNINSALADDMLFATSTPISDIQLPPPMVASSWDPLPPLPASVVEPAEHLAAAAAQLSDLENEIIARTLLSPVQPSVLQHQHSIGQKMPTNIETSSSLPPLFRPPVIDSPPPPTEIIPLRRQNSIMTASNQTLDHIPQQQQQQQQRSTFQRMNSVAPAASDLPPPYTIGFVSMNDPLGIGDHRDHGQDTCIFARLEQQGQAMASQQNHQRPSATATLVRSSISSNNEGVNNSNTKKRTKKMRRSRNIHPMVTHHPNHHQEQQPSEDAGTWASRSASAGSSVDEALYSAVKAHQYEQPHASSSQLDTSSDSNAAATAEATTSDGVYHISGGGGTETDTQQKQQKVTTKSSKTGTLSNAKRTRTGAAGPPSSKKINLPPKASKSSAKQSTTTAGTQPAAMMQTRPLSSTSSRISQAKADHFNPSSDVVNLNNLLLPEEMIDEADAADA